LSAAAASSAVLGLSASREPSHAFYNHRRMVRIDEPGILYRATHETVRVSANPRIIRKRVRRLVAHECCAVFLDPLIHCNCSGGLLG
jgi:hypothetical protein